MLKKIVLFTLFIGVLTGVQAQKELSWRKHKKEGEKALAEGRTAKAALHFEKAWQQKQKKLEFIFQAGEAYYTIKDYRKAAEAYQHVKDKNDQFPLVGLKYARSLKQDGQYEKAADEFRNFKDRYTGEGKAILEDIIKTEIQGCEFGEQAASRANRDMEVRLLSNSINSDAKEFAPFPVSNDLLYFSSSMGGKARIYSSERRGQSWEKAAIPNNFPVIQNEHFCNGNMSPTGERFYFTICNADKAWNDLNARCELFVTKKNGASWSAPERLPDYVNKKGITVTHPFAIHQNGQEYLYFASNREGGRGGMDIWYVTRDLGIDNNDFTFPVNLGPSVNTLGDEITPYYDSSDGVLYFASNGHISMGGFDILKTRGEEMTWSVPENLGMPLNSSADDYFYIGNGSTAGGFLVSNRVSGGLKTTTQHEDIFEFTIGGRRIVLKGNVYNQETRRPVNNIQVTLYQLFDDGTENQLVNKPFSGGTYAFELLPERKFRVVVESDGFVKGQYQFMTNDPNTYTYGQPLYLVQESSIASNTETPSTPDGTFETNEVDGNSSTIKAPAPVETKGATYTSRGTSRSDKVEYVTTAPRHSGVYFKIQLVALKRFNPKSKKFVAINDLGRFDTEKLVKKNITRVLLAEFFSQEEAVDALETVKDSGFPRAFIVQYEDGERYGKIKLN